MQSLEAKAKALEAHEDLIRARSAAKLEVDSLYRLNSPHVIVAAKLLETLTDSLFREFAHVEAHRDQLIYDDLAAVRSLMLVDRFYDCTVHWTRQRTTSDSPLCRRIQLFLATFSALPPTSSTSRHALCKREDEDNNSDMIQLDRKTYSERWTLCATFQKYQSYDPFAALYSGFTDSYARLLREVRRRKRIIVKANNIVHGLSERSELLIELPIFFVRFL
ncbi:hypothetical protein, variant 3 [Aphanomyces invadans]|uniref:Uncharacterized protein n=1 Tax=Aphanomyces invadans TaxID=157072 RepID=A0A024T939_9STRA|nr:hypothetical protein, variant 3 [Aphanomyces invadans]ETV90548.1 hypothetical protein, variant 3 [Aphanomyces invadans]|eukprot:XP_008880864.1 hypothetical protein, variant 3 [Aphanomyces invadans]